jgi:hypothetical protein
MNKTALFFLQWKKVGDWLTGMIAYAESETP